MDRGGLVVWELKEVFYGWEGRETVWIGIMMRMEIIWGLFRFIM